MKATICELTNVVMVFMYMDVVNSQVMAFNVYIHLYNNNFLL